MSSLPAAPDVGDLVDVLSRATDREPLVDNAGKSGALIERLTLDGERFVVKYLDPSQDWTIRAAGVPGGVSLELWTRGLLQQLPDCFEQPIVGLATGVLDAEALSAPEVTALFMRDVGPWMVEVSDELVTLEDHLQFLDHMAALHARFWEAGPEIDIVSAETRFLELSPRTAEAEARLGSNHVVPQLIAKGWPLLSEVAPVAAAIVVPLANDPSPLVTALATTPQTLVHGNFKLDNLGVTPDRRTVILDWEGSGRGAPTGDLAWYLAINCRRLPQSKEESIEAYRASLERQGVVTEPWWDQQIALSLLGALVQFGWEKAFGGLDDELAWWQARAVDGARLLR